MSDDLRTGPVPVAFPLGYNPKIAKLRYIKATRGDKSQVYRTKKHWRQASLQDAKEHFMWDHGVASSQHGEVVLEELTYDQVVAEGLTFKIL